MIGLSPLSTAHPSSFQPTPVRASSGFYPTFTLAMDRSPGFGSTPQDLNALLGLAFAADAGLKTPYPCALQSNSLAHYAKGMPSGCVHLKDRHIALRLIVGVRFQVLFHSPQTGVLFTFPSRYLCTIGRWRVFSLGGWSPQIRSGFHVSRPTWDRLKGSDHSFRLRDFHPLWCGIPTASAKRGRIPGPYAPDHTAVPLPPIRNGCVL